MTEGVEMTEGVDTRTLESQPVPTQEGEAPAQTNQGRKFPWAWLVAGLFFATTVIFFGLWMATGNGDSRLSAPYGYTEDTNNPADLVVGEEPLTKSARGKGMWGKKKSGMWGKKKGKGSWFGPPAFVKEKCDDWCDQAKANADDADLAEACRRCSSGPETNPQCEDKKCTPCEKSIAFPRSYPKLWLEDEQFKVSKLEGKTRCWCDTGCPVYYVKSWMFCYNACKDICSPKEEDQKVLEYLPQ